MVEVCNLTKSYVNRWWLVDVHVSFVVASNVIMMGNELAGKWYDWMMKLLDLWRVWQDNELRLKWWSGDELC